MSPRRNQTFFYFGWLTLFVCLAPANGFLVDIQTSYILKNQLHATASQVSTFRLATAVPAYFAFVFGLTRDLWSPLGLRDRGFFLIFAPVNAAAFVWIAFAPLSYRGLLTGMLLAMTAAGFISAAYQGLIALVGQEQLMSGRLSTLWNVVAYIPGLAGAFASGYVSEHLHPKETFIAVAVFTLGIGFFGFWKPRSVFAGTYEKPQAKGTTFVGDLQRLVKHRAIYPAVLIMFLFSFAPGMGTPLQFYLTNELHASDAVFSYFNGIFLAGFLPTFLLYGFLCKRVPLRKLLWWGTVIAVPQVVPLALIHSANAALVMAAPIGLMGGLATLAYYDLAMRSCPPGLQGTLMMMVAGVFVLATRGSDVLGTRIYGSSPTHGFLYCVIATTLVYALILPSIWLVPKALIATADGEAIADVPT